ncbi:MAG TPA: hypothetical protein VHU42_02900 [Rhodopila sp.]|jgi:hypothetical protein|nr:hypothetical protein [Rhodopila sp.]
MVRDLTYRVIAVAVAMALAGCSAGEPPPGMSEAPGTVRVHMNGWVGTTVGVVGR